jgi:hypothetical protein
MSLETKIIKLKMKYDKLARREPSSGQQVLDRMIWERLRNILIKDTGGMNEKTNKKTEDNTRSIQTHQWY